MKKILDWDNITDEGFKNDDNENACVRIIFSRLV